MQGIFIDVFAYDVMPNGVLMRKCSKILGKKILRLLHPKYSAVNMGHSSGIYKMLGRLLLSWVLEKNLHRIIQKSNTCKSPFLGYGYDSIKNTTIKRDDIYPLKRVTFESMQFNAANRPDVILTQLYGDYLTLPPEHQRKLNHCRELVLNM